MNKECICKSENDCRGVCNCSCHHSQKEEWAERFDELRRQYSFQTMPWAVEFISQTLADQKEELREKKVIVEAVYGFEAGQQHEHIILREKIEKMNAIEAFRKNDTPIGLIVKEDVLALLR